MSNAAEVERIIRDAALARERGEKVKEAENAAKVESLKLLRDTGLFSHDDPIFRPLRA